MARVAMTLRIDEQEKTALEHLSRIVQRPINHLLSEAVKGYLKQQSPVESSLTETLRRLREYRERDPDFSQAITQFVAAEVSEHDPVEGVPFVDEPTKERTQGPVQSRLREMMHG